MDDSYRLIYRNARLEAEIEVLKKQLTQANKANQYLLQRLSSIPTTCCSEKALSSRRCGTGFQVESNGRLALQKPLATNFRPAVDQPNVTGLKQLLNKHRSVLDNSNTSTESEVDLLGSENEGPSVAGLSAPLSPESLLVLNHKNPRQVSDWPEYEHDLGQIEPVAGTPTNTDSSNTPCQQRLTKSGTGLGAFTLIKDGKTIFVPGSALNSDVLVDDPQLHQRPLCPSVPFVHHEFARLMGAACFLEDMSAEAKVVHWRDFAERNPRHSAEEWKEHYELVVRPAYLKKTNGCQSKSSSKIDVSQGRGESSGNSRVGLLGGLDSSLMRTSEESKQSNSALSSEEDLLIIEEEPVQHLPQRHFDEIEKSPLSDRASALTVNHLDAGITDHGAHIPNHIKPEKNEDLIAFDSEAGPSRQIVPEEVQTTIARSNGLSRPFQYKQPIRDDRDSFFQPREVQDLFAKRNPAHPFPYQSVLIDAIPVDVTLGEVLDKVAGGKIVSSALYQTAGMRTVPPMDGNTALIQFLRGGDAQSFVASCRRQPLTFSTSSGGTSRNARVRLIYTSSRYCEIVATRVLFVHDIGKKWTPETIVLTLMQSPTVRRPLRVGYDQDGIIFLEFANMMGAKLAWQTLSARSIELGGVSTGFLPDPCDRPVVQREIENNGNSPLEEQMGPSRNDESPAYLTNNSTKLSGDTDRRDSAVDGDMGLRTECQREQDAQMMEG